MSIIIGIDVGISTTKIVGIDPKGNIISPITIKATDPVTSLYGAFGKYLHDNKIKFLRESVLLISRIRYMDFQQVRHKSLLQTVLEQNMKHN